MPDDPFDAAFLRKLELLELAYRRLGGGHGTGESPGRDRGGRTDFRQHRRYSAGDDFRHIDWNVYGRVEALFVKEYAHEEQRTVAVLLDCSRSMAFGRPSKLDYGKQLAAAFGYLALVAGDEAVVAPFSDRLCTATTISGQRSRINEILRELRPLAPAGPGPGGRTRLGEAIAQYHASSRHRSLVVLISDLLGEDGLADDCRRGLALMAARGFEPCVVHLLSREEVDPARLGRLRLQDAETGRVRQLWFEDAELQQYKAVLNEFIESWKSFCGRHGIPYVTAVSDVPFEEVMLGCLRDGGMVR